MPFPPTHPALARALADKAYLEPTPVQAAVLDERTGGRDLLVSAQTGSGKTVAYGLALATTLLGEVDRFERAEAPLALVVAPTRELAMQVHRELEWLYAPAGGRIVTCVGGMDVRKEQRALEAGAHIVVGTPGRLRDHLERGRLDTSAMRAVVLDEADEMLDLGFREDLTFILDATPQGRRTLLFSATIAPQIAALARQYQRDAIRIDTIQRNQPHGDIEYRAFKVAPNDVEHAIVNVLRFHEAGATLVFCATREGVKRLHASLQERGFAVVALSGELSQNDRTQALQSLRDGRARVCVATDVAARGLDLPDLGLVIHADLPNDSATLLHRSGRTGRAGRKGLCALIVPYTRRRKAETLIAGARVEAAWVVPPSADEIRARDQERLFADPLLAEPASEEDLELGRALLAGRTAEEVAAALIRLHRSRLPAPEDILDTVPDRGPRPPGERRPRMAEADDGPRRPMGETAWFRMSVGRQKNADPKWLLPMICRLGHVTKKDVGAIKIGERETSFEIAIEAADRFAAAVRSAGEGDIRIRPATDPRTERRGPPAGEDRGALPRHRGAEAAGKPYSGKPAGDQPGADRSAGERPFSGKPYAGKRPRTEGDAPARTPERPFRTRAVRRPEDAAPPPAGGFDPVRADAKPYKKPRRDREPPR
ncbi:MAG: DEAD/DEAH box helicase [Alsobacter sp.]